MPQAPAQQQIQIEDIQDGIITLKGGGLRAVLMTTSVNFSLKSTDEQDALIYVYQGFVNSLDFPIQILVISRQLDISNYLVGLEQKRKEQPNELLRIQIAEYTDFVKNLVQMSNIMTQTFLVIVPLSPVEKKESGFIEKLGLFQKQKNQNENKSFSELKAQLWQRVEYVTAGLNGVGIKATPLNNQELMDLFYHLYNMGLKEKPTFGIGQEE